MKLRTLPPLGLLPAAVLLVLLAFPAAGFSADKDVKVFYPPGKVLVLEDTITVEGSVSDPEIYDLEIVVNGEETYRTFVRDFLFSEEVYLEEGNNTVKIGELLRSVYYAPEGKESPPDFKPIYGHYGLDDSCAECHEISDEGEFLIDGDPGEVCGWCHNDLLSGGRDGDLASVHAPVRGGECLSCHTPHLSRKAGLPVKEPPVCRDCHAGTYERLDTERYVHGPLNLGDCRLCHTIHSSKEKALLNISPTVLCTQCHSGILPKDDTPAELRPHPMIPEGECGRCHFPHSSENPRMMRQPSSRICYSCHPEKTRSFHESKGFSIYVCQKCHDLHRPTTPHLIVDNSRFLCLECHEFRDDAAFTHEFIKEGGCFICHTFHEAPLSDDIAVICLRCHGDNPRLAEAHRGIAIEKSRCTLCHLPHQADKEKLLMAVEHSPFEDRECGACHEERAELMGKDSRALCLDCHEEKSAVKLEETGAKVHPPAAEEECSFCHLSHLSPEPALLKEGELAICLKCHREFKKATIMKPKSSHESVLKGECHLCHEPHASRNPAFLKKPMTEVCGVCHLELQKGPEGAGWASLHPPVDDGKCRLCHRPHTSRKPSLLKTPMPKVCRPCHQDFFRRLKSIKGTGRHKPVAEGTCDVCHQVHGSDGRVLLAADEKGELCTRCHPKPQGGHHRYGRAELEETAGKAAGVNLCVLCHRPHSSQFKKLLRSSASSICTNCHKV